MNWQKDGSPEDGQVTEKMEYVLRSGPGQVIGCGCHVCPQCSGNSPLSHDRVLFFVFL